jgi:hypothetical protein
VGEEVFVQVLVSRSEVVVVVVVVVFVFVVFVVVRHLFAPGNRSGSSIM